MPITKFSLPALKEHLRKFFIIYLVGIIICGFGADLLWTMTRPQVPIEKSVAIYLADGYTNPDPLDDIAADMLARGSALHEDLEEVVFYSMGYSDPAKDYTGSVVMATRLATQEVDAIIANKYALENLINSGACMDIQPWLEEGWLEGYDLEPCEVTFVEKDIDGTPVPGTEKTFIGALKMDNVDALWQKGAMQNDGACLVIIGNSVNLESTRTAVEIMIEDLMEGIPHASAESSEPES